MALDHLDSRGPCGIRLQPPPRTFFLKSLPCLVSSFFPLLIPPKVGRLPVSENIPIQSHNIPVCFKSIFCEQPSSKVLQDVGVTQVPRVPAVCCTWRWGAGGEASDVCYSILPDPHFRSSYQNPSHKGRPHSTLDTHLVQVSLLKN